MQELLKNATEGNIAGSLLDADEVPEERLIQSGKSVVAIPLDSVISVCAPESRERGCSKRFRAGAQLHLVNNPGEILALPVRWLSDKAIVITTVPKYP